jgi:hypothetical protein
MGGQAEALPCPVVGRLLQQKLRRKNMTKFFSYAAIVIGLGATASLAISPGTVKPTTSAEVLSATDGAFRDGLYLGKLAAEGSQPARPAIGRWSTEKDRTMFTAGYRRGYSESLTSTQASAGHAQSTE